MPPTTPTTLDGRFLCTATRVRISDRTVNDLFLLSVGDAVAASRDICGWDGVRAGGDTVALGCAFLFIKRAT